MKTAIRIAIVAAVVALPIGYSRAALVLYIGSDAGVLVFVPGPGSLAAQSAFDAAAVSFNIIDFESAPVGDFVSLAVAPGVTVSGVSTSIRNTPITPCFPSQCGINTTAGGSQFESIAAVSGSTTFSFTTPIEAFGALLGGLQGTNVGQQTIAFFDGSSQTVNIPILDSGFAFVGFTDLGRSISSVSFDFRSDIVSVDDIRYKPRGAVPEPATLALLGLGLAGLVSPAVRSNRFRARDSRLWVAN